MLSETDDENSRTQYESNEINRLQLLLALPPSLSLPPSLPLSHNTHNLLNPLTYIQYPYQGSSGPPTDPV